MQKRSGSFDEREINADPLSAAELDALIGAKDYVPYLNTRNELYRERDMKTKKPGREEALKLMAAQPNLMKRPILVMGKEQVLGFDEQAFREALK
jgi:arsenate reductase (glutaredoxin)